MISCSATSAQARFQTPSRMLPLRLMVRRRRSRGGRPPGPITARRCHGDWQCLPGQPGSALGRRRLPGPCNLKSDTLSPTVTLRVGRGLQVTDSGFTDPSPTAAAGPGAVFRPRPDREMKPRSWTLSSYAAGQRGPEAQLCSLTVAASRARPCPTRRCRVFLPIFNLITY